MTFRRIAQFTLLFALLFTAAFAPIARAQSVTGVPPFSSIDKEVNESSLDVHLAIPIYSRNGTTYSLNYDSDFWTITNISGHSGWTPTFPNPAYNGTGNPSASNFGWNDVVPLMLAGGWQSSGTCTSTYCDDKLYYVDNNGTAHKFIVQVGAVGNGRGYPQSISAGSTDGAGYLGVFTWSTTPTYHAAINSLKDADGNTIAVSLYGGAQSTASVTDTNNNSTSMTTSGTLTDPLGQAFTLSSTSTKKTFSYTGGNGPASTVINYSSVTISTAFGCTGINEYPATAILMPNSVQYFDGSTLKEQYAFTYTTNGRLSKITLPTGGAIKYTYTDTCSNFIPSTVKRQPSTDGTTFPDTWTYSRTGTVDNLGNISSQTTTITAPTNNSTQDQTQVKFAYGHEISRSIYTGPISGTPIVATTHCYNYSSAAMCTTATGPSSALQAETTPLAMTVLVSYNGGSASKSTVFYGDSDVSGHSLVFPTKTVDYDFNGQILRTTLTPHGTYSGGACAAIGGNVLDRLCYKNVYNATVDNSNLYESTWFTYDTTSGNIGNLLTVNRNAGSTVGRAVLTTTYTYNANGSINTVQEPNGATTTYSNMACGFFPQTIQSDQVSWNTSATYDCVGGVITSSTDANLNVTNFDHFDMFYRLTKVASPYQGSSTTNTSYSYGTNTVTTTTSVGGTSSEQTVRQVDGLGRTFVVSNLTSAPGGPYSSVSYAYDHKGRIQSNSVPCSSTNWYTACSGAQATYTYDGADRVLTTTNATNGTITKTYGFSGSNLIVTSTLTPAIEGTTNARKDYQIDGLGRIQAICELGALPNSGSCGSWSGNGYLTTYAYDPVGRRISAGGAAGSRTFNYDWVGRLLSETHPESGTKTYTYDSVNYGGCGAISNPGDLVMVQDNGAANTACFWHDKLHRPTRAGEYSGTFSSWNWGRSYVYDSTANAVIVGGLPNGVVVNNPAGHLIEAETDNATTGYPLTPITDEWFSYETSGKLVDMYQMTPSSGGYMHTTASFYEDGQVQSLAAIPGLAQAWSFGLGTYGELNQISENSNAIVSGITRNANHSMNTVTFSNGTDAYTYDNAGKLVSGVYSVASGSVTNNLTWSANGTLSTFQVTDTFHPADNRTCNFSYDDIARLVNADCGTVGSQSYSYDQFGNISKTANGWGGTFQPLYNSANQITNMSMTYDVDGNITNEGLAANGNTYIYDTLMGKITEIHGAGTPNNGACVVYDAFGQAVETSFLLASDVCTATGNPILYSPIGKLGTLATGGTFSNGARIHIPTPVGDLEYIAGTNTFARVNHRDWLGSVRFTSNPHTNTSSSGADYAPFGEITPWGSIPRGDFTGQDHLTAPDGTYDFPARKYSAAESRWLSPDPTIGNPMSPQTFNKYAYLSGNPLAATDPEGFGPVGGTSSGSGFSGGDGWSFFGWSTCDNCGGDWADMPANIGTFASLQITVPGVTVQVHAEMDDLSLEMVWFQQEWYNISRGVTTDKNSTGSPIPTIVRTVKPKTIDKIKDEIFGGCEVMNEIGGCGALPASISSISGYTKTWVDLRRDFWWNHPELEDPLKLCGGRNCGYGGEVNPAQYAQIQNGGTPNFVKQLTEGVGQAFEGGHDWSGAAGVLNSIEPIAPYEGLSWWLKGGAAVGEEMLFESDFLFWP